MASIGKGTKVKYALNVQGLGEKKLSDADVDFKLDFYAREKGNSPITSYFTVRKADAKQDESAESDGNTYFVICDTSNLDYGAISATLRIEYTDEDMEEPLVEILSINTTERITDIPASAEPVEGGTEEETEEP